MGNSHNRTDEIAPMGNSRRDLHEHFQKYGQDAYLRNIHGLNTFTQAC
jgi:hypothetical protein